MTNLFFCINNIVENSNNPIDRWANTCLNPLHGLLRILGKTVRVFQLNTTMDKVVEVPRLYSKNRLAQIIRLCIAILLFIPTTILGLSLKGIAQLMSSAKKNNKLIINQMHLRSIVQSPVEGSMIPAVHKIGGSTPGISNQVFMEYVVSHLTLEEICDLSRINRAFCRTVYNPCKGVVKYRGRLKGIGYIINETNTFASLISGCYAHVTKFNYTLGMQDIFGGLEHFLAIPCIELNKGQRSDYLTLERFTHSVDFQSRPSILRVRLDWLDDGLQEIILIKYTLFVPQESSYFYKRSQQQYYPPSSEPIKRDGDSIWHDYLFLTHDGKLWNDARDDDHLPSNLRRIQRYPEFSYGRNSRYELAYRSIISPSDYGNDVEERFLQLKAFIKAQKMAFTNIFSYRGVPFLENRYNKKSAINCRLFRGIPVALGHKTLEDMYSQLEVETIPNFVIDKDRVAVSQTQPFSNTVIKMKE